MRVIRVIGTTVAAELDRLGVGSDVIIAALIEELGLTTAQAREVLAAVRSDRFRAPVGTVHVDGRAVS
jgi:hypothetical protein